MTIKSLSISGSTTPTCCSSMGRGAGASSSWTRRPASLWLRRSSGWRPSWPAFPRCRVASTSSAKSWETTPSSKQQRSESRGVGFRRPREKKDKKKSNSFVIAFSVFYVWNFAPSKLLQTTSPFFSLYLYLFSPMLQPEGLDPNSTLDFILRASSACHSSSYGNMVSADGIFGVFSFLLPEAVFK